MLPKRGSRVLILDGTHAGLVGVVTQSLATSPHFPTQYKGSVEVEAEFPRSQGHKYTAAIYSPDQVLLLPENVSEDQVQALTHILCSK